MEILLTRDLVDNQRVFAEILGYEDASRIKKIVYSLKRGKQIETTIAVEDIRFSVIFNCNELATYSVAAELQFTNGESQFIESNFVQLSVSLRKAAIGQLKSKELPRFESENTIKIVDADQEHALFVKFNPNKKEILEKSGKYQCGFKSVFSDADRHRIESHPMKDSHILNLFEVIIPEGTSNDQLLALALELDKAEEIEYVSLETTQVSPPIHEEILANDATKETRQQTPDFTSRQTYQNPPPGMNVKYAWQQGEIGQNAVVRHLDFGVIENHEDLQNINIISAAGSAPDHGSASLGCINSTNNGFGTTGIAYGATTYAYNTGQLSQIVADSNPGDIVSLDIQLSGCGGQLYPYEFSRSVWDLVKTAVDSGVIVIAAAGNGNNNLDTSSCGGLTYHGDNGGMLVGAGSSSSYQRLYFSNYGTQVKINSWGENVTTTGYGYLFGNPGGPRSYTYGFNGTSSATPLCAGALALIQSYAKRVHHVTLNGYFMRNLLAYTGNSSPNQHIGVRPDVQRAMNFLDMIYRDVNDIENITQNTEADPLYS